MKKHMECVFILTLILVFNIHLFGIETGEIQGRVKDEQGADLPSVQITAQSPSLQGTRSVFSSARGEFRLPLLPVGVYTLTIQLKGFNPVIQKDVIVRLGAVTSLRITMKPSKIQEKIVVISPSPLIDKTSTDTSYYITSEELEKLPAQERTIVDVVKFTPGVTGVRFNTRRGLTTDGQPSFRGEGEEGNTWIVDGLAISGVRLKNSGMHLNFDSIDEIQIISDHFSPDLGSAYGGIINIVTKTGGNNPQGEISLVFQDKNLQASRMEQLSAVSDPDEFSRYNAYFNIGGPFIKNKFWFFLSNNYFYNREETRDSLLSYFFVPGGKKAVRTNNIFTKLSYALHTNHNLSFTTIFHKSLGQEGGIGIPDLFEEKNFSDIIFRINYKGILNTSTFVEAGIGQVIRDSNLEPVDSDLGPSQYYIEDLARNIHNSYGFVIDDQKRTDLNIKLTTNIETEKIGRHEFVLGFEYYNFSSEFSVDFTGKNEDLYPNNGFDAGTKYYFSTWREGQRTPTFFYEYGVFSLINSSRGIGIYLKDKITWKRFTFMAGFRSQTQICLDNEGEKLWSWNLSDFISPRFSLAIDLTGDGKNVLKLAWGRFSDLITTMPLGLLNSGAGLSFRNYRWQGGINPTSEQIHDPANWLFENEQKSQPFEVADGIDPNFLTRILVEFDRKIGKDWAVKARYIQAKAKDLLEVIAVFDPVTDYKFLFDNFEYKRRDYRGFEIELLGKIGSSLFINASYCHASAKGTNPGQMETGSWDQEEGNTNFLGFFGNHLFVPAIPNLRDLKDYIDWALGGLGGRGIGDEGWYGKLPYSVDHTIKLNILWDAPYGFVFSTSTEWLSGYYWEKLGYVPFFGGYYAFPEGRGTRTTPPLFYVDTGLEKEFRLSSLGLPPRTAIKFRIDVLNLLNSQKTLAYVKQDIPIFGQIWSRQQPRQARIHIRIIW